MTGYDDVEIPDDPEDGLTPEGVSALYTYVLGDDDPVSQLDRAGHLEAWLVWWSREGPSAVTDVEVVCDDDGVVDVRPVGKRRPRGEVEAVLPADLQRRLLDSPVPGDAAAKAFVATGCVSYLLDELVGVLADEEKMYGHLALTHGLGAYVGGDRLSRRARHRDAHHAGGGTYGGHRAR